MAAIACSVALRSRPDGVQGSTTTSATATAAPTAYSCGGVSMIVVAPGIERIISAHCAAPPTLSGNSEILNGNRPGAALSAPDRWGSDPTPPPRGPRRYSSPAKLIATVVLPTPPLRCTTDMTERTYSPLYPRAAPTQPIFPQIPLTEWSSLIKRYRARDVTNECCVLTMVAFDCGSATRRTRQIGPTCGSISITDLIFRTSAVADFSENH